MSTQYSSGREPVPRHQRGVEPAEVKERESLGAGAAGGAALGAVIALGIASSTATWPLIGAIIGAVGGAGLGHIINGYSQKRLSRGLSPKLTIPARVEDVISQIAANQREQYNWKQSIVDLMKLLNLDSSASARNQLAQELGYKGALDGSVEMNNWLHEQVMIKLVESSGKIPDSLKKWELAP